MKKIVFFTSLLLLVTSCSLFPSKNNDINTTTGSTEAGTTVETSTGTTETGSGAETIETPSESTSMTGETYSNENGEATANEELGKILKEEDLELSNLDKILQDASEAVESNNNEDLDANVDDLLEALLADDVEQNATSTGTTANDSVTNENK